MDATLYKCMRLYNLSFSVPAVYGVFLTNIIGIYTCSFYIVMYAMFSNIYNNNVGAIFIQY